MASLLYFPPNGDEPFPVELDDVFEVGGQKLATVRAIHGKPFVGGHLWPVRTEFAKVPVSRLAVYNQAPALADLVRIPLELDKA